MSLQLFSSRSHTAMSVLHAGRGGVLIVDARVLPSRTATQVLGLGVALSAFLAGILVLGTML